MVTKKSLFIEGSNTKNLIPDSTGESNVVLKIDGSGNYVWAPDAGTENLAEVLSNGNTTDGYNIEITGGSLINSTSAVSLSVSNSVAISVDANTTSTQEDGYILSWNDGGGYNEYVDPATLGSTPTMQETYNESATGPANPLITTTASQPFNIIGDGSVDITGTGSANVNITTSGTGTTSFANTGVGDVLIQSVDGDIGINNTGTGSIGIAVADGYLNLSTTGALSPIAISTSGLGSDVNISAAGGFNVNSSNFSTNSLATFISPNNSVSAPTPTLILGTTIADQVTSGADGYIYTWDAGGFQTVLTDPATIAGTPAGADTEVQFNDGGSFGADSRLTWDSGAGNFTIDGKLTVTGLIDPTGLVLTAQATKPTSPVAPDGIIWIGSDDGYLYFNDEVIGGATVVTANLAQVLQSGNTTGNSDIILNADGYGITSSGTDITITPDSGFNTIIDSDTRVTGNLIIDGYSTSIYTEQVNVEDNNLFLNQNYTATTPTTGGLTVNYLPTSTSASITAFTAGVNTVSQPTLTAGSFNGTFAVGDFVMISSATDAQNDGLYEVLSSDNSSEIQLRGVGTVGTEEDFTQNQLVTDASGTGTVTKINISVLRSGTDGYWEIGISDNTSSLSFNDVVTGSLGSLDWATVLSQGNLSGGAGDNPTLQGTDFLTSTIGDILTIRTQDSTSSDGISIFTGDSSAGTSGEIIVRSQAIAAGNAGDGYFGSYSEAGTSGDVFLTSEATGAGSGEVTVASLGTGSAGGVSLYSTATAGDGGDINIYSEGGSGVGGAINIRSEGTGAPGGDISLSVINEGTAPSVGGISLTSTNTSGPGGAFEFRSEALTSGVGGNFTFESIGNAGDGGDFTFSTTATGGGGGDISFSTVAAAGQNAGTFTVTSQTVDGVQSGDIVLQTVSAAGNSGDIKFVANADDVVVLNSNTVGNREDGYVLSWNESGGYNEYVDVSNLGSETWAQVLANGNVSAGGGTAVPTIAAGDFITSVIGTDLELRTQDITDASTSDSLVFETGADAGGSGGSSGDISIKTGNANSAGAANGSGSIEIATGDQGGATGDSGSVTIHSGARQGGAASGDVSIYSGSGNSEYGAGSLLLSTGSAAPAPTNSGSIAISTQANGGDLIAGINGDVEFTTGNGSEEGLSSGDGGDFNVTTGDSGQDTGTGGNTTFTLGISSSASAGGGFNINTGANSSTGPAGGFLFSGGSADSGLGGGFVANSGASTSGTGGQIALTAGAGATGGPAVLTSGEGTAGAGGVLALTSGNGSTNGGAINITSGSAGTGFGGKINIVSGAGGGTGTGGSGGDVEIVAGTSNGTGDNQGASFKASSGNATGNADGGAATLASGSGSGTGEAGEIRLEVGGGTSTIRLNQETEDSLADGYVLSWNASLAGGSGANEYIDVSAIGTENLQTVLDNGNTTGGFDIEISDGDAIVGESGGVVDIQGEKKFTASPAASDGYTDIYTIPASESADGSVIMVEAKVLGRNTGNGDSVGYKVTAVFERTGATITQVGSTSIVIEEEESGAADWAPDITTDGTDITIEGYSDADTVSWLSIGDYVVHTV